MDKKPQIKLKLNKETFRKLTAKDLQRAVGGMFSSETVGCKCSSSGWETECNSPTTCIGC